MATIDFTQITNATTATDGTGVFDKLIQSINIYTADQFDQGRITGPDFATVYLGSMQYAIAESMKFVLNEQQIENDIDNKNRMTDAEVAEKYARVQLLDQQRATEGFETAIKDLQNSTLLPADNTRKDNESAEKVLLLQAQTLGFASDTKQKVLKQMLDGYAVNLSIAGSANIPETVGDAAIDQLSQEILTDVGSTVDIQSTTQTPDVGD